MARILLIGEDPPLTRILELTLRAHHHRVEIAADIAAALAPAGRNALDLVIVDLDLTGMSGVDVVRTLQTWSRAPIIALTAHRGEEDMVAVLDAGADDCVAKPPGIGELLARVRVMLRQPLRADEAPVVHTAAFTVDLAARQVIRHDAGSDHAVRLTPTEWQVLDMLVRNPGKLISQQQLLSRIWGPEHSGDTNYLRVYLRYLRRKLEPDPARPRHLITEPRTGYRFQP